MKQDKVFICLFPPFYVRSRINIAYHLVFEAQLGLALSLISYSEVESEQLLRDLRDLKVARV